MTTSLFVSLLVGFASINTLVTEIIKTIFNNFGKEPSANLLALIDALVIGGGGTAIAYLSLGICFSFVNVAALIGMIFVVGICSMVGYDKVIQLIEQLKLAPMEEEKEKVEE